jgi:hypothetical protein
VSGGSYAEKIGIRVGDVIECSNGEDIRTIFEVTVLFLIYCICSFISFYDKSTRLMWNFISVSLDFVNFFVDVISWRTCYWAYARSILTEEMTLIPKWMLKYVNFGLVLAIVFAFMQTLIDYWTFDTKTILHWPYRLGYFIRAKVSEASRHCLQTYLNAKKWFNEVYIPFRPISV